MSFVDDTPEIERMPSQSECMDIVYGFGEIVEQQRPELGHSELIKVRPPIVISGKTITIDHDRVDEMGLKVFVGETNEEYDEPKIVRIVLGHRTDLTPTLLSVGDNPDNVIDQHRETAIRSIAEKIHDTCTRGFWSENVTGYRYEFRDPDENISFLPPDEIAEYPVPASYESTEREYVVGTVRYDLEGVVTDSAWWEARREDAKRDSAEQWLDR